MGEDRNPASFWYCGGRLGARAGQDSAYWRPESAARSRPLAACLLGVSQQRPPPPEHSEPRGLGNVIVTLATVDGNAVHSPRSGFRGRGLGGAQSAFGRPAPPAAPPPPLQGVGRSLGVSGRCGGRCAGRCSPWCTLPPACSPPIHPLLPRPLPPATRAGSSVFQVTSAEMPSLTTQAKVTANLFSWPDLVFISFTVSLSSKSIYVVFPL